MGFIFIGVYFLIVLMVIEISTLLFSYTGLKKQISRFQVISMMTGTGFTTKESELIIDHPIRRRICGFLILFGAFSLAVIISAISNLLADDFYTSRVAIVAALLVLFLFIIKMPKVKKSAMQKFNTELEEKYELKDMPMKDVFLIDGNHSLAEMTIKDSSVYQDKPLSDFLQKYDLTVLFIKRGEEIIRNDLTNVHLNEGDLLYLYGDEQAIEDAAGS
ncbi:cation:proton antiporter regulatory subunit [Cytobacillus gottheilii]|uniref:cation:proton antiporter regulatory subunit n=1 Tax=Cytobacillus gottheilii TaxID=859144 RepID=UPI0009BB40B0|nr:TrkA C-terminal domain-containing protein [Cytobacillus gottheilii]